MISKTDLWQIFKEHEQETGQVISPLMRNHILEILQRVEDRRSQPKKCLKSPTGKHEFVPAPDSFDDPFCKYCFKTN